MTDKTVSLWSLSHHLRNCPGDSAKVVIATTSYINTLNNPQFIR